MIRLDQLRYKSHKDTETFAKELDISKTTLTRIEAASSKGKVYHVNKAIAYRLVEALKTVVGNENLVLENIAGVSIAPPRTGRPKAVQQKAEEHEKTL